MPNQLSADDVPELRQLAYNARRTARTADRYAAAEPHGSETGAMLADLAGHAAAVADGADALAAMLEGKPHRDTADG